MAEKALTSRRTISASLSRSWLLVNAFTPDKFASAYMSNADQVILDLEDAVDASGKDHARRTVVDFLSTQMHEAWVRINTHSSSFWSDDVDALHQMHSLSGVVLAKTESPFEVMETFDRLGGRTPVVALIESAVGIESANDIAKARGVLRLAFGSGDYRKDTGASACDAAMSYPRNKLVVASRIGGLPGPIDGPTVGQDDQMTQTTWDAAALGMTGKLCLFPEHTTTINSALQPLSDEVSWARAFLAEFAARGRVVRDGSDLPRLGRAERIVHRADEFGI